MKKHRMTCGFKGCVAGYGYCNPKSHGGVTHIEVRKNKLKFEQRKINSTGHGKTESSKWESITEAAYNKIVLKAAKGI